MHTAKNILALLAASWTLFVHEAAAQTSPLIPRPRPTTPLIHTSPIAASPTETSLPTHITPVTPTSPVSPTTETTTSPTTTSPMTTPVSPVAPTSHVTTSPLVPTGTIASTSIQSAVSSPFQFSFAPMVVTHSIVPQTTSPAAQFCPPCPSATERTVTVTVTEPCPSTSAPVAGPGVAATTSAAAVPPALIQATTSPTSAVIPSTPSSIPIATTST
ncbi:hypothetical protein PHISCL_09119, partial [Aspergillus sclerotialis]